MRAPVPRALAGFLAAVAAAAACSSESSTNDTCRCEVSSVRIACASSQCVNGEQWECTSGAQLDDHGACTSSASDGGGGAGSGDDASAAGDDASTAPDTSCSDLSAFCDAHCQGNASVYADCTRTAQQGDAIACSTWQASSSASCR